MIEVALLRENPDSLVQALTKRGYPEPQGTVDALIALDLRRRENQKKADELQAEMNQTSKQIGQLMKEGHKQEAEQAKSQTASLKQQIKELAEAKQQILDDFQLRLRDLPNLPDERVPEGHSEEDNIEEAQHFFPVPLPENPQAHWDLIERYDLIDFPLGSKITGSGFPVYKREGAALQRALVNFFLDEAHAAGYTEYLPPYLVNEDSGFGTGQLPDKEGQMYHIPTENLFLIPTAEVPITNIYRDELLSPEQLPLKMAAYSPCFRREAGSWGAHVRGLNRLHQFEKVEIVQIAQPEQSEAALKEMCQHVEQLLTKLELPYRKLLLCAGDLGFAASITYDYEVWSAAQERWLEVSSVSNFKTFQSNRMKLRVRSEGKKNTLPHTLNGSALALPRVVAALLENNQTAEGIRMPKALKGYTRFEMIGQE